jgi:hypothetical protein
MVIILINKLEQLLIININDWVLMNDSDDDHVNASNAAPGSSPPWTWVSQTSWYISAWTVRVNQICRPYWAMTMTFNLTNTYYQYLIHPKMAPYPYCHQQPTLPLPELSSRWSGGRPRRGRLQGRRGMSVLPGWRRGWSGPPRTATRPRPAPP